MPMSLYIQYHNGEKRGLPNVAPGEGRFEVSTAHKQGRNAEGTVFVIASVGRPKCFYLWETFAIETVEPFSKNGTLFYHIQGPGWQLSPPQRLIGPHFETFKNSCANFVCFRKIDDLPYSVTLKRLAEQHRAVKPDAMQPFLEELLGLVRKGTDDHDTVLKLLTQSLDREAAGC
jgi:hypothetical protein